MFRPRIIPVLLLKQKGLVKSIKFKDHRYIGDPINATRIFNERKADELIFLDIDATREGRTISGELVKQIGDEAQMPFAVGGGITNLKDIEAVIKAGAEKVVLGTAAAEDPAFVRAATKEFASSTITVCADVRRSWLYGERVVFRNGQNRTGYEPPEYGRMMADAGVGELIVQCIERDGTRSGFDLELIRSVSEAVEIPVVALGGAGSIGDLESARSAGASAVAAGSLFVYHGKRRGVLINYPEKEDLPFYS